MNINRKTVAVTAITASILCMLLYFRALSCDFVNFDDHEFILNLEPLRKFDLGFIKWAFTAIVPSADAWIPLNWISLALDYWIWGGYNPLGFHLTSVLIHTVNVFLVVLIADALCKKRFVTALNRDSGCYYALMLLLSGLLFGLHPLRVEAVVWMTERRGVLNGLFSLSSILLYIRHTQLKESADVIHGGLSRYYVLSFMAFICSLMAKQVSVVLPVMLLVLDWFPLGRLSRKTVVPIIVEKIPYLIASFLITVISFIIGTKSNLISFNLLSFGQRVLLSGNAIFEYWKLTLFPIGILPQRIITTPFPASYTVKTLMVIAIVGLCIYAARRSSWIPAVMLFFLIPIFPTLSFFQVNDLLYGPRHTYLPSVAISIMAAYGIAVGLSRISHKKQWLLILFASLTTVIIICYGAVSFQRIGDWKNSATMWTRVITHHPYGRAYFLRGLYYVDSGKFQAAISDYTTCLKFSAEEQYPEIFQINIYAHRGEAYAGAGLYEEAVRDFTTAIGKIPHPLYYYHRGLALKALGRITDSEEDMKRAGRAKGQMLWINS